MKPAAMLATPNTAAHSLRAADGRPSTEAMSVAPAAMATSER